MLKDVLSSLRRSENRIRLHRGIRRQQDPTTSRYWILDFSSTHSKPTKGPEQSRGATLVHDITLFNMDSPPWRPCQASSDIAAPQLPYIELKALSVQEKWDLTDESFARFIPRTPSPVSDEDDWMINGIYGSIFTFYWTPEKGYGMFATSPIMPGTVVHVEKPTITMLEASREDVRHLFQPANDKLPETDQACLIHFSRFIGTAPSTGIFCAIDQEEERVFFAYDKCSRINHSCGPNASIHLKGGKATLIACHEIAVGEEITINYHPGMPDVDTLKNWGFVCQCLQCKRVRD